MHPLSRFEICVISALFPLSFVANAESVFPTELIDAGSEVADLSKFNADGKQLPGQYQVDIYINDNFIKNKLVDFKTLPVNVLAGESETGSNGLTPCLNASDLSEGGVKTELFPDLQSLNGENCSHLGQLIPGALSQFNFSKMRLNLSIPQKYVRNNARGYIDPVYWDNGITAALLNYNLSGSQRFGRSDNNKNIFLGLNSGLNFGPWRLRDSRNLSYNESGKTKDRVWQRINTYLERPVIPFRSTFLAGEASTGSDIFDSVRFRGMQLKTDDNMYPDSLRGFAPTVRGVAESNAEVSIRQNGYIIYKTVVSPGPFEISDLNPMATSGDLEVSVKEASGYVRVFTVPYASVPVLLREGRIKYGLIIAQYRTDNKRYDHPTFAQSTMSWGTSHGATVYGGTQLSQKYKAIQTGLGFDMGQYGAISADITHARSILADDSSHTGQSMRFLYGRAFPETGTRLRLTGYRYSTKGFHTLEETALKSMKGRLNDHDGQDENGQPEIDTRSDYYDLYNNKRARIEANISQSVGSGSVWISGVKQTYWNSSSSTDSFSAGYSSSLGPANYSLSYSYTRQKNDGAPSYSDQSIGLSISVPFSQLLPSSYRSSNIYANYFGHRDGEGNYSHQAGMSGTLLEEKNLNWNVSQGISYGQQQSRQSGNAGLSYRGSYGNTSLGYSYGNDYQQISYGASGGLILHSEGITFGQSVGESAVLLSTNGVSDVSLRNEPGVSTDWRGYAIKSYAQPYRENSIGINVNSLGDKADLNGESSSTAVPTKGAVIKKKFDVRYGFRILFTLMRNGKPLPFGSMVTSNETSGLVDESGMVYLTGMPAKGTLKARWGKGVNQSCQSSYDLNAELQKLPMIKITNECL